MKELYEVGFVLRGFVISKCEFKKPPILESGKGDRDLRGAFISAINSFASEAFMSTSIEYLEMDKYLFIFKIETIRAQFNEKKEPIILYCLTERTRNPDRFVRKFFEKAEPILQHFIQRYSGSDFTELNKFESYDEELKEFFD
jgi:hypothetical protein